MASKRSFNARDAWNVVELRSTVQAEARTHLRFVGSLDQFDDWVSTPVVLPHGFAVLADRRDSALSG
jgi:hypothetical protein